METLHNLGYKIRVLGLEQVDKNCHQPTIFFEKLAATTQENHTLILATCLVQTLKELRNVDAKILSLEREFENLEGQKMKLFYLFSLCIFQEASFSPPFSQMEREGSKYLVTD